MHGHHKASRRWTWHSPNGQHHNQIDYILVRKRFRSGVNIARTQSFPGADIGSDHDLLMMTFHLRLKRISKPKHKTQVWPWKAERSQRGGNLPSYDKREVCTSHHHEQWRYRHGLNDHHLQHSSDWNSQWDPLQNLQKKKPWVTAEILDLCNKRRELRKKRLDPKGSEKYKEVNNNIKRCMKKAKENWIGEQCSEIEENLRKNDSKRAYQRDKGKLLLSNIFQENLAQKHERYWTNGQNTVLSCMIMRQMEIHQYWIVS